MDLTMQLNKVASTLDVLPLINSISRQTNQDRLNGCTCMPIFRVYMSKQCRPDHNFAYKQN